MTSSQWLDLAVLAVALVAAMSGWRSGALGSLLSFIGVAMTAGAITQSLRSAPTSVVTPGCVTGASVVPLVTVDESERDQACGVPAPGRRPDGLHR